MRIALIGNDFIQQFPLEGYGGIEACVEAIAGELSRRKMDFTVFVPARKHKKEYPFEIIESRFLPTCERRSNEKDYIFDIKKMIGTKPEFDIIWSQSHWSATALLDLQIPIICTFHDSCSRQDGWLAKHPQIHYRFISNAQRSSWNLSTEEHKRASVIYNGFEPTEYITPRPASERYYYLWVGGLNWGLHYKGLDLFIEIAKANPEEIVVAYGSGHNDLEAQLYHLNRKLLNFTFLGSLQRGNEHIDAFSRAKALIMPTRLPEAFGRVVVEAFTKGTPVFGSNQGSLPELIPSDCGEVLEICNFSPNLHRAYDHAAIGEYSKKFSIEIEVHKLILKSHELIS